MEGVPDVFRLQQVQLQQLFRISHGQGPILFCRQSRHPPAGLAGNGHSGAAWNDYLPHFFQQHSRTVQIHLQDGFDGRLGGRDSGTIDQVFDVSEFLAFPDHGLDGSPVGQVHFHRFHIEASLYHDLGNVLGVLYIFVSQDDFLSIPHPAGHSHGQLTGTSNQQNFFIFHNRLLLMYPVHLCVFVFWNVL